MPFNLKTDTLPGNFATYKVPQWKQAIANNVISNPVGSGDVSASAANIVRHLRDSNMAKATPIPMPAPVPNNASNAIKESYKLEAKNASDSKRNYQAAHTLLCAKLDNNDLFSTDQWKAQLLAHPEYQAIWNAADRDFYETVRLIQEVVIQYNSGSAWLANEEAKNRFARIRIGENESLASFFNRYDEARKANAAAQDPPQDISEPDSAKRWILSLESKRFRALLTKFRAELVNPTRLPANQLRIPKNMNEAMAYATEFLKESGQSDSKAQTELKETITVLKAQVNTLANGLKRAAAVQGGKDGGKNAKSDMWCIGCKVGGHTFWPNGNYKGCTRGRDLFDKTLDQGGIKGVADVIIPDLLKAHKTWQGSRRPGANDCDGGQ